MSKVVCGNGLKCRLDDEVGWDHAALLNAIKFLWRDVFAPVLGRAQRHITKNCSDLRNGLAHFRPLTMQDAKRALDTFGRLADAVEVPEPADAYRARRGQLLSDSSASS